MEQKAEFKTSLFGGYEKESVLKYIDDMSRTAAESEAKLQEQIEQITRSRQGLEEQIAEFEKRMQDASETIDAEKGKNKKLSEMIGLLQEEIDAMDDEAFQLYLRYHFATCEREDMLGVSNHVVDIFRV